MKPSGARPGPSLSSDSESPSSLGASRGTAAAIRVETVAATDGVVRAVEEYGLVATSARKA
jgi:hypothetical protein